MSNSYKLLFKLYQFFLVLMVFWSQHAWFTWILDSQKIIGYGTYFIFFCVAFYYKKTFNLQIRIRRKQLVAIVLLCMGLLLSMNSIKDIINDLIIYPPLIVLAADKRNSEKHLKVISKVLGIVVILGIIPYLQWLTGTLSIKGSSIVYGDYDVFYNYYLMIVPSISYASFRYQSVFLEPGNLGTLCALFLFINNYNLKKYYNVFLLVALLFSLSLAGYVLFVVGYFLYYVVIQKKRLTKPLFFFLLLCGLYYYIPSINGGDNSVNYMIIERLNYDDGNMSARNDRFDDKTNNLYDKAFANGDIWFGMDSSLYSEKKLEGSGYKLYILRYGIIPYLLIWFFYWIQALALVDRRHALSICLILYLCFLKATALTSYAWLVPFFLYLNCQRNTKEINFQISE